MVLGIAFAVLIISIVIGMFCIITPRYIQFLRAYDHAHGQLIRASKEAAYREARLKYLDTLPELSEETKHNLSN